MTQFAFHPIADTFPLMEGDDYERFADDVAVRLHEPIVLYEDKILDGRNRYRACLDRGREPTFTDYDGDDPIGFVVSKNLHRRHMDEGQRSLTASRLAQLPAHRPASQEVGKFAYLTQTEAADLLNVSERSVRTARKVDDQGSDKLVKAVEHGDVSVSDAAAIVDLPKAEQNGALRKVQKGEAGTLREAAGRKPKPPAGNQHDGAATANKAAERLARQQGGGKPARDPGDDEPEPAHSEHLDSLKKKVPESIQEIFGQAGEFRSLMKAIADCRARMNQLCQHPAGGWIDQQDADRMLKQAHAHLRFAMPYTECPKCRRKPEKSCGHCKGAGWINETAFGACASNADKAWLEGRK